MQNRNLDVEFKKIIIFGGDAATMLNFREYLIKDLVALGHEVYCLAWGYSEKDRQKLASWGAMAVDSPLNCKGLNPLSDLISLYKLWSLFKCTTPDVVFSYFAKPVIFGTLAAKLASVPRMVGMIEGLGNTFTVMPNSENKKVKLVKSIQVFLYRMALPLLHKLIFLNQDDKYDLIYDHKIKVNNIGILGPIGLDLSRFQYKKPPVVPITFLFIGRLLQQKGVFEFIEAAKIVKQHHKSVRFVIVGGYDTNNPFGLKPEELEPYLSDETVDYLGHVSDIVDVIQQSSVFVLPSYREGMPRSTQEAMAIGRPVITTDVPGCRETVVEGVNGFLIPPFSSVDLTEKMLFFINNPKKIEEMGLKSREIAEEEYDVHVVNKHLISLILGDE